MRTLALLIKNMRIRSKLQQNFDGYIFFFFSQLYKIYRQGRESEGESGAGGRAAAP